VHFHLRCAQPNPFLPPHGRALHRLILLLKAFFRVAQTLKSFSAFHLRATPFLPFLFSRCGLSLSYPKNPRWENSLLLRCVFFLELGPSFGFLNYKSLLYFTGFFSSLPFVTLCQELYLRPSPFELLKTARSWGSLLDKSFPERFFVIRKLMLPLFFGVPAIFFPNFPLGRRPNSALLVRAPAAPETPPISSWPLSFTVLSGFFPLPWTLFLSFSKFCLLATNSQTSASPLVAWKILPCFCRELRFFFSRSPIWVSSKIDLLPTP